MRTLRPTIITAAIGFLVGVPGLALAQGYPDMTHTSPAEKSGSAPPAVSDPANANKTLDAPVAGKNSFTLQEARSRLEHHGYSQVTALTQDDKSVWHASAVKNGKPVAVTLDYQGNITEGKVTQGETNDE
jgi:hypothetical protein